MRFGQAAVTVAALWLVIAFAAARSDLERGLGHGSTPTEVIAQVVAAMELEADYRDLARVHHLHPSLAELVTDAVAAI